MNRFVAINPGRCIGCGTCQAACSEGHKREGLQEAPRLSLVTTKDISAVVTCHQCEGSPCLLVCPVNAISNDEGFIHINEQTCIGCKLCAIVCPFGAIKPSGTSVAGVAGVKYATPTFSASLDPLLRWEVGVYTRAIKCDMCSYDPRGPHCVSACLTNALSVVDSSVIKKTHAEKQVRAAVGNDAAMENMSSIRRK
ncbi:MAG: 4Fe-4S dicluster domain-containing protein [Raoultibacter sp.]